MESNEFFHSRQSIMFLLHFGTCEAKASGQAESRFQAIFGEGQDRRCSPGGRVCLGGWSAMGRSPGHSEQGDGRRGCRAAQLAAREGPRARREGPRTRREGPRTRREGARACPALNTVLRLAANLIKKCFVNWVAFTIHTEIRNKYGGCSTSSDGQNTSQYGGCSTLSDGTVEDVSDKIKSIRSVGRNSRFYSDKLKVNTVVVHLCRTDKIKAIRQFFNSVGRNSRFFGGRFLHGRGRGSSKDLQARSL